MDDVIGISRDIAWVIRVFENNTGSFTAFVDEGSRPPLALRESSFLVKSPSSRGATLNKAILQLQISRRVQKCAALAGHPVWEVLRRIW